MRSTYVVVLSQASVRAATSSTEKAAAKRSIAAPKLETARGAFLAKAFTARSV
jgi:hypothetical protein